MESYITSEGDRIVFIMNEMPLQLSSVQKLLDLIKEYLEHTPTIDMTDVKYLDSVSVALLLRLKRLQINTGKKIEYRCITREVKSQLRLMGLEAIVE